MVCALYCDSTILPQNFWLGLGYGLGFWLEHGLGYGLGFWLEHGLGYGLVLIANHNKVLSL